MKFQSNAIFNGLITANQVSDAGVNTGKFLVLTSSGVMAYRTAAEILSDIGAASSAQGVPAGGTAGQILSKVNGTDYNTTWIDNYSTQIKNDVKLGATLTKGTPVYVSSSDGTNIVVSAAGNGAEATSSKTMGLLETGGATNATVKVITYGLLAGLDTSTATAGDPVWLGPNGTLLFGLANKPVAPVHMVYIGVVTRVQSVNGEIFVNVQNGFEMGELHNYAEGSVANNQVIVYESATSLYKPKSIPTILGYTPANAATTLTINDVTYDLSANRSWTISSTSVSTRVIQKFTADGTTATYTITGGYTVGMVDVYVNGIKLDNASGVEFTATNGTTVVLVSTPASGDIVEVYKYGSQFIANNALRQKTLFTATAGQTTFTVTYSVGMVDVFYNGSKLDDTEYTATNGTSIVLGTACALNDKVEVIAYSYNVNGFTGIGGSGTTNYLSKFTASGTIGNSLIYDNGTSVGIGTASPSGASGVALVLNSGASQGRICIKTSATGDTSVDGLQIGMSGTSAFIEQRENDDLTFATNASERMRITSSGNVGIGTNNPANYFTTTLTIDGSSSQGIMFRQSGIDRGYSYWSSDFMVFGANTGGVIFKSADTERMRILNNGYTGINTTSPESILHISGGAYASSRLTIQRTGGAIGKYSLGIQTADNNFGIVDEAQGGLTRFLINASGNIGIGITAPTNKLHVYGTATVFDGMLLENSNSNAYTVYQAKTANSSKWQWGVWNDNSYRVGISGTADYMQITSGGYIILSGPTWGNTVSSSPRNLYIDSAGGLGGISSIRASKNNINNVSNIDWIYRLNPVTFNYRKKDEEGNYLEETYEDLNYGLIAEDTEQIADFLINYNPKKDGTKEMVGIEYSRLITPMLKAIQEQNQLLQEQQQQIDDLKKLIN